MFVYTGKDAAFSLYEDEGTTYNYEKGAFANIPFTYNETTKTLTIEKREGNFNGMLAKRTFRIIWISKDRPKELNATQKAQTTVQYNGEGVTIKMK